MNYEGGMFKFIHPHILASFMPDAGLISTWLVLSINVLLGSQSIVFTFIGINFVSQAVTLRLRYNSLVLITYSVFGLRFGPWGI